MSIAARRSHRGDEYQLAIATHWLIKLIHDPDIISVQIEAVSLPDAPQTVDVDDIIVIHSGGNTRYIQAKKNQKNHETWSLADETLKEELVNAYRQLQKTPQSTIELCSRTPFGELAKLAESTLDYGNYDVFAAQATSNLKKIVAKIQKILSCEPDAVFNFVKRIEIGPAHDFGGWETTNKAVLSSLVTDVDTAIDVIERLIRNNQSGLSKQRGPLHREGVVEALKERNVFLSGAPVELDNNEILRSFAKASADLSGWKTTLPNSVWLDRPELGDIEQLIAAESSSLTLLLGEPGCGKSALLARLAQEQAAIGVPVLAIKADFLAEEVNDLASLGDYLQIPADPVSCVLSLAMQGKVVVFIDQLDALAELVVQHSTRLRAPIDLIRSLSGVENVHVVASCRVFEHRHDTRLRNLEADAKILALPSWNQVDAVLKEHHINASTWNASIRDDLRVPQALNLFLQLAGTTDESNLLLGYQHMLGELWKQRVLSDQSHRTRAVLFKIAERMAERETLWLPEALFDDYHSELQKLASAGIIISDAGRVGFRHQSLYEFIRVRMFMDESGKLTETILTRQHSLRIRPLLWHSLGYMREVDRQTYTQELRKLWHADIRPHLKMLLIEFLGQLQDPDSHEASLVAQKWDDPWYRNRVLGSVIGSLGWFDHLAPTQLPHLMDLAVEQAHFVIPILCRALPPRQSEVLNLVKKHWLPFPDKDVATWRVLEQIEIWDEPLIGITCQVLSRTRLASWTVNHIATVVSAGLPEQAPLIVDAWLRHEAADNVADGKQTDRVRRIFNSHELYDLPAIAEAAPSTFLKIAWPWLKEIAEEEASDPHPFVIGYRQGSSTFMGLEDDEDLHREKPFVTAISTAVRTLAEKEPAKFVEFLSANKQEDLMPVQRLLAMGLVCMAEHNSALGLHFLLEDPRRLVIGSFDDSHRHSKRLIASISRYLKSDQIGILEGAIRSWNRYGHVPEEDVATRRDRMLWTRQHRLRLLRSIPQEMMSEGCKRFIAEEERAFPDLRDRDIYMSGFRAIGSPMEVAHMKRASDAQILNLFSELTDETQWDHPHRSMQGGAIQASRELAELTKASPERAINLIRKMEPKKNEMAVGAVLRALGENKYDAAKLYTLVLDLNSMGFDGPHFRQDVASAIDDVVSPSPPIPSKLLDLMESWLKDAPTEEGRDEDEEDNELSHSVLWTDSGLMVLPQGNYPALRAITGACLYHQPSLHERWLSVLERHLKRKESSKVWNALCTELKWLNTADKDRSQRFLRQLFNAFPTLFDTKRAIVLLAFCQRWIDFDLAVSCIDTMANRDGDFAKQAAGELLMLRYAMREDDPIDKELEEHVSLHEEGLGVERVCTGIAYATAELWKEAQFRNRLHFYLLRLMKSENDSVLKALTNLFRDRELKPDYASRELLVGMCDSPRFLCLAGNDYLGECLVSVLEAEPDLVSKASIALLDAVGDDLLDQNKSSYFLPENLLTISLRLQEMGAPHQASGVQIFERILEFNAPQARDVIVDLDKRTPNYAASPAARRRRRKSRK